MSQAIFADIAHHLHVAIGKGPEIADQIGTPIAAAHHTDFYWFCHIIINLIWFLFVARHLRHLWPEPHLPELLSQRNAVGWCHWNNRLSGERGGRMPAGPDASPAFE